MLVYLRDGSAQTIVGAATPRQMSQIKLCHIQSQYTDTGPTSPSTDRDRERRTDTERQRQRDIDRGKRAERQRQTVVI